MSLPYQRFNDVFLVKTIDMLNNWNVLVKTFVALDMVKIFRGDDSNGERTHMALTWKTR